MKWYIYKILRSLIWNFVLGNTSKDLSAKTIDREEMGLDKNKILQYSLLKTWSESIQTKVHGECILARV